MAKKVDPIKLAGLEVEIITPVGISMFNYLESPDFEYNKNGDYKTRLFFDPEAEGVKEMTDVMDELVEKALPYFLDQATTVKAKKAVVLSENTPYYNETDDNDEETGRIYINAKSIASGVTKEGEKWKRQVAIYDANGDRVAKDTKLNIGNGTTMALSLTLRAYFNKQSGVGISLRLEAVQIIELVEYTGGKTAEQIGFKKVEGGFAADKFTPAVADDDDKHGGPVAEVEDDEDGDY